MDYRHEWKHEINHTDLLILRQRLRAITNPDPHAINGRYMIRSLYFDNTSNKALQEKLDGISHREKFRIRFYNNDLSLIRLEKKTKIGSLGKKQNAILTSIQAQSIVNGYYNWMPYSSEILICELYTKMKIQGLRPKIIVDYIREPYIFEPGNVRVTLDYNIRAGFCCSNFLNPDCTTIPAGDAPIILEVKWDYFLPDIIRDAIQLPGRHVSAFSKYAQCRIYG